ncbi:hypothetical protein D6D23_10028 [Aureobasidium pullulans]|nr:hypothetical protein D6D23_10028 [Aureobasidium pullulans]
MRTSVVGLFALPATLFSVIFITPVNGQDWPYNLPAGAKYFPEHEHHIRRDLEIQQRLNVASPSGIRKMSEDEGEKFFLDYWQFGEQDFNSFEIGSPLNLRRSVNPAALLANISNVEELLPPLLLHAESQQFPNLYRFLGRGLSERAYQCPTGTDSCVSIGYPNSCCATGETCISLPENDGATIGCCPDGASCGGEIGLCDTAAGYTSCDNENGGCCVPGYSCQGIGCVYASTATTTTTLPTITVTTGASWSTLSDSTTTQTLVVPGNPTSQTASICTTTTTLVIITSGTAVTATVIQTTTVIPGSSASITSSSLSTPISPSSSGQGPLTCSPGFRTCPASLGGGCCHTDRACGSQTCPPLSTAAPPVLPTSGSGSVSTSTSTSSSSSRTRTSTRATTSPSSTVTYSGCPTGFYMCSAYYLGGCCRVGRNCDTTSCPTSASTAVVTNSDLTVIAPSGATSAGLTGSCANGWFSCAARVGGGCCPSGYGCGTSCTAMASGQSNVGKGAPSEAAKARICGWVLLSLGIISGAGMIFL